MASIGQLAKLFLNQRKEIMNTDIQTKRNDDKEAEIDDILESLRDTLLLETSFRITKDSEGNPQMVELYDYGVLHGFDNMESIETILEQVNDYYLQEGSIKEVGCYDAYILLSQHSDSDGSGATWTYWELDYISVYNFITLEQMERYEIKAENKPDNDHTFYHGNELPF